MVAYSLALEDANTQYVCASYDNGDLKMTDHLEQAAAFENTCVGHECTTVAEGDVELQTKAVQLARRPREP